MTRVWILAALLLSFVNSAGAAVIISNAGVGSQAGTFSWQYLVTLQPNETLQTGDFFTIFDVPNILKTPQNNFDVLFSAQNGTYSDPFIAGTTPHPGNSDPTDNPNINNIQITLTGPNITPSNSTTILGTLTVKSSVGKDVFQSADYAAADLTNGLPSTSTGSVNVAAVPEPASVTMLVLGLLGFGAVAMRRRQNG